MQPQSTLHILFFRNNVTFNFWKASRNLETWNFIWNARTATSELRFDVKIINTYEKLAWKIRKQTTTWTQSHLAAVLSLCNAFWEPFSTISDYQKCDSVFGFSEPFTSFLTALLLWWSEKEPCTRERTKIMSDLQKSPMNLGKSIADGVIAPWSEGICNLQSSFPASNTSNPHLLDTMAPANSMYDP